MSILLFASSLFGEDFKRALPGRTFSFPRDHFSHPEFKTEWWYYSGHLQSPDKQSFGYQLTFFRTGLRRDSSNRKSRWAIQNLYFAHLALTDESQGKFDYREKISRGSLGEAGALSHTSSEKNFRIWIENWMMEGSGPGMQNHLLKAGDRDLGIQLMLTPERDPVVHGLKGIRQKAEGEGYASHYYSITRLKTEGRLLLKGKEVPVNGLSWMDHEFGSDQLREYQAGWDWFSIQMDNGADLMFYQIRQKDGKPDPHSGGTILFSDGKNDSLTLKDFKIQILENWKSPKSGASYPSRWSITAPGRGIALVISPTVKNQELITNESTHVTYWEGSVNVEGRFENHPSRGKGYVELTGYVKPFSKGI